MIDTTLLHHRIADRAEDFLRELFGDDFKTSGSDNWRVGKRGSLAVSIQDGVLVYYSHEAGVGGDAIGLWQRERGGTAGEALRAVAAWAGVSPTAKPSTPAPRRAKPQKPAPAPLTKEQVAEAREMSLLLADDAELCRDIAKGRGWQPETLRELAVEGVLGWYDGKLAFIYDTGIKLRWQEDGERIIRFYCGNAGRLWRACRLTPSVRKVYICEGETDVITLIDAGAEATPDCLVVGLPSASTIPAGAIEAMAGKDVVLCLDHDDAGRTASAKLEAALRGKVSSLSRWNMSV